MAVLPAEALQKLAADALITSGASVPAATATARALILADLQGIPSHGASRAPLYCAHLRNGRVAGDAVANIRKAKGATILVDAGNGLAYPACELAIAEAISRAGEYGIGFAAVVNSNHFGMAAIHLDPVAAAGMVGIGFSNSPGAMPMPGGKRAVFGTNPIAAVFPCRDGDPISIDLSLSEVARGKLMVAAREGRPIPEGWALDASGEPTTDPNVGLAGMMVPMGGAKGAMLALTIELLCVALTGSAFAFEADSFFSKTGNQARLGHGFLVIDPAALAGSDVFQERLAFLVEVMTQDAEVRLPGARRLALSRANQKSGLNVPDALIAELEGLARSPS